LRALLNVKTCIGLPFPPRYLMGIKRKGEKKYKAFPKKKCPLD
jgi:hypothetical protein